MSQVTPKERNRIETLMQMDPVTNRVAEASQAPTATAAIATRRLSRSYPAER